jgi:hypothetical protein
MNYFERIKSEVLDGGVDYLLKLAKPIKTKNETLSKSALGLWNVYMLKFTNITKDELVKLLQIKEQLEQQNYDSTRNG